MASSSEKRRRKRRGAAEQSARQSPPAEPSPPATGAPWWFLPIAALGIFYAATLYWAAHPKIDDAYRNFLILNKPIRTDAFLRKYRDCLVLAVGIGEAAAGFGGRRVLASWGGALSGRGGENYAAAFFRGRKIAERISPQPAALTLSAGLDLGEGIALAREFRLLSGRHFGYALRMNGGGDGEDAMQGAPLPDTMHFLVFDKKMRHLALGRFPAARRGVSTVYLPPADSCR